MRAKIRVYGKSQSRTALGIINAYLKLFPNATLSDLQRTFPKSLNSKSPLDSIIVPLRETQGHEKLFFEREDELIVLKNGQKLALVEAWSKEDFDAICEHVEQFGIDVAEIEETKPFEKGSYELKFLDGYTSGGSHFATPATEEKACKCKCKNWWWWLLPLLLLLLLLFCWKKCCCHGDSCSGPALTPPAVEATLPTVDVDPAVAAIKGTLDSLTNNFVYDTGDTVVIKLPDGKEWKIGENSSEYKLFTFLNSDTKVDTVDKSTNWITLDRLYFETGKSSLTPDSKKQLENIAMILKFFPNSHIKMGGYTDNTGTDDINLKLSSERAKVTAEQLISFGIKADRVSHEGFGSQHPICPANDTDYCRALNRRIDVRVSQK